MAKYLGQINSHTIARTKAVDKQKRYLRSPLGIQNIVDFEKYKNCENIGSCLFTPTSRALH